MRIRTKLVPKEPNISTRRATAGVTEAHKPEPPLELKLHAADNTGSKVVNQRSDPAAGKSDDAVENWDGNHNYQPDNYRTHASHGLAVSLWRQARDGRAEDHDDESVDDSDQQSDYKS